MIGVANALQAVRLLRQIARGGARLKRLDLFVEHVSVSVLLLTEVVIGYAKVTPFQLLIFVIVL